MRLETQNRKETVQMIPDAPDVSGPELMRLEGLTVGGGSSA